MAETPFKDRYRNHVKSFKHSKYSKETELSKYVWELKDSNKEPSIKWKILKSIKSPLRGKSCSSEKLFIINNFNDGYLLNNQSEFVS